MQNDIIAFISKHKFLLCIPVLVFLIFAALPPSWSIFMYITGTSENPKLEVLKLVGWGISGLIAIFGVFGLFQRATALDKQNKINEDAHKEQAEALNKQHEMTEKGHIHERFKAATAHLGNERDSVRIAAFNEFYRLAKLNLEPGLKETVFDILCAHLRQTTKHKDYTPEERVSEDGAKEIKPTEEVQSLLNILFKPDNKGDFFFDGDGIVADLEGTNLHGANLRKANLRKANLRKANLQNADITDANLQEAKMWEVDLRDAFMRSVNLQKTSMAIADLRGAKLCLEIPNRELSPEESKSANLQEAFLFGAKINQDTTMPNGWKNIVSKFHGKIGVKFVDDEGNVKESKSID